MSQGAVARNSSTAGDVNRTGFLCGDVIRMINMMEMCMTIANICKYVDV